jgi:hypothetical protein
VIRLKTYSCANLPKEQLPVDQVKGKKQFLCFRPDGMHGCIGDIFSLTNKPWPLRLPLYVNLLLTVSA